MSKTARDRASRMAEFREADAAYKETGKKEHEVWRHNAMRSRDMRERDWAAAQHEVTGSSIEAMQQRRKLMSKFNMKWEKEQ